MGKPRFKPARICANPRHFGRIAHPAWARPCPLEPTEAAWAIFQHRAAYAVLTELRTCEQDISDLATQLGEEASWLQRKLHGQTPADLGDIMNWTLLIGIDVLPVFNSRVELQPTPKSNGNRE